MRTGFLLLRILVQENNTSFNHRCSVYLVYIWWKHSLLGLYKIRPGSKQRYQKDALVPLVKVGLSLSSLCVNHFKRPGYICPVLCILIIYTVLKAQRLSKKLYSFPRVSSLPHSSLSSCSVCFPPYNLLKDGPSNNFQQCTYNKWFVTFHITPTFGLDWCCTRCSENPD